MTTSDPNEIANWSIVERFQKSAPVAVVELAKELGLSVWTDTLPDGIKGKICLDPEHGGSSGYSIIVNNAEEIAKQRFTIAHEIGHFLLHRAQIGSGLTDDALYNSGLTTLQEVQANRAANEILMPFKLIEEAIKSGSRSIADIAAKLDVTEQTLRVRLQVPD